MDPSESSDLVGQKWHSAVSGRKITASGIICCQEAESPVRLARAPSYLVEMVDVDEVS